MPWIGKNVAFYTVGQPTRRPLRTLCQQLARGNDQPIP